MSNDQDDDFARSPIDADALLAAAVAADARSRDRSRAMLRDFLLPDAARLDDRMRAALRSLVRVAIGTIGADLQAIAIETLRARGAGDAADALDTIDAPAIFTAIERGVAAQADVADELIDRVALDLIGDGLAPSSAIFEGQRDLLPMLVERGEATTAPLATALMAADSRRRMPVDQPPYATDLPASVQERLVWAVAAAIRATLNGRPSAQAMQADVALSAAALRVLAAHDEEDRLEIHAHRLAQAITHEGALHDRLEAALADRRIALFVAVLADALDIAFQDVRAMVANADDSRLWLALRALDLPRTTIARIGYALCEADPRRDVERFADLLDALMATDTAAARDAIAPLTLPRFYREACAQLSRGIAA